jgi:hypothetical protein
MFKGVRASFTRKPGWNFREFSDYGYAISYAGVTNGFYFGFDYFNVR